MWVRVNPGRIQGKDVQNPYFKLEDGPIRGSTVPWEWSNRYRIQGSAFFRKDKFIKSWTHFPRHRKSWSPSPRQRKFIRSPKVLGSPGVFPLGREIHHQPRSFSARIRCPSSRRKNSTLGFGLKLGALPSLRPVM